MHNKNTTSHTG